MGKTGLQMERELKRFFNEENRQRTLGADDLQFAKTLIEKWFAEHGKPCAIECSIDDADTWYMRCDIDSSVGDYDLCEKLMHDFVWSVENGDPPMYLPLNKDKSVWTWKFYHPECPDQFLALTEKIEKDGDTAPDMEELAEAMDDEGGFIVPKPKDGGNCAYVVLRKEFYDKIESGEKTNEYREYNEYYVGKFLSHKVNFIKMNLGYSTGKSMTFAIRGLSYLDAEGSAEVPCYKENGELTLEADLPSGFVPRYFKVSLGKRVR